MVTFYTFNNLKYFIVLAGISELYCSAVSSDVSIIAESNRGIYIAQILFFGPTYSFTRSTHV